MSRLSVELPDNFLFSTTIPVRITDINYGGHLGNDSFLTLIHEARVQFLKSFGYTEKDLEGVSMIMADVAVVFKNEVFYGDEIIAHVSVTSMSGASFDIVYKLEKKADGKYVSVAHAKTGMVCFDYAAGKISALPEIVRSKWAQHSR